MSIKVSHTAAFSAHEPVSPSRTSGERPPFHFSDSSGIILKQHLDGAISAARASMKKLNDNITSTKNLIASPAISDSVEEDLAIRLEMVTLIEKMAQAAVVLKELEDFASSRL